jgi:hypothetical protein
MTYDYAVFGGVLRSELEFPDLSVAIGGSVQPAWHVRVASEVPSRAGEECLGSHPIAGLDVRLFRSPNGLRLDFVIFGEFLIRNGGTEIEWYSASSEHPEMVRAVILGPALALALHESGTPVLHGSAVGIDDHAIALLAPKRYGKSTLALALMEGGATLISDDAIAVDRGAVPMARPGIHSVRLCDDSAEHLRADRIPGRLLSGVKSTLVGLPSHRLAQQRLPLAAVYVLQPMVPGSMRQPVARAQLSTMHAVLALSHHMKVASPLIGLTGAGAQLQWAAEIGQRVPVYSLGYERDFSRLDEVVADVLSWHTDPSTQMVGVRSA